MATVIDSFVVEFGLDPSRFTAGQRKLLEDMAKTREAATKFGADLESHSKRIWDIFSTIQRGALGLGAAFLGGAGFESFINTISSTDAATGRLARSTGMAVNELSAWQEVMKQFGGTADDAKSSISGISGEINRFLLTGSSQLSQLLLAPPFNIDIRRFANDPGALLGEINSRVQRALAGGMQPAMIRGFLGMMPGMNDAMVNAMLSGNLEAFLRRMRAIGGTTEESKRLAQEYEQALASMGTQAGETGRQIGTQLFPALTKVLGAFQEFLKHPKDSLAKWWHEAVKELTDILNNPERWISGGGVVPGSFADKFLKFVFGTAPSVGMGGEIPSGFSPGGTMGEGGGVAGNNNPGRLAFDDFAKAHGATGADKNGLAIFPTLNQGRAAMEDRINEGVKGFTPSTPILQPGERILPLSSLQPGAGAVASIVRNQGNTTSNSTSNSAQVGQVVIHAPGADSEEVGRNVRVALERNLFAMQANYGSA